MRAILRTKDALTCSTKSGPCGLKLKDIIINLDITGASLTQIGHPVSKTIISITLYYQFIYLGRKFKAINRLPMQETKVGSREIDRTI